LPRRRHNVWRSDDVARPLRHRAVACVAGATGSRSDPADTGRPDPVRSAHDGSRPRRRTRRRWCRREDGMRRQVELVPADRVHAAAPWAPQRERMPARRRAVPAGGTDNVAIAPISGKAFGIVRAQHDGPAARWDGDGFQQRARHRDRRSVHVEHDSLVADPNDAVPRAAAQPTIYVTLETSPQKRIRDRPISPPYSLSVEHSPTGRALSSVEGALQWESSS